MKKKGLLILAGLVAAGSIISSCKKEKTPDPQPPVQKNCTISKIFDANAHLQSEYIYAGDKLSKINNYDSMGTTITDISVISYDAAGNVSKVTNTDEQGTETGSQTYTYNASGTIGKVTVSGGGQDIVLNFEYNGADPKKVSNVRATITLFGAPFEVAHVEYFYDAKGNNTQSVTYAIDSSQSMKKQSTTNYTFDDKRNPNQALAAIMLSPAFGGPNNVTKETNIDHTNNNEETFTQNVYEYNSDNYPIKVTATDDQGTTDVSTIEYSCK